MASSEKFNEELMEQVMGLTKITTEIAPECKIGANRRCAEC